MQKRPVREALGQTVAHKRLGPCVIDSIVAEQEGKIKVKVLSSNEEKILLFSSQFFDGIDDFETVQIPVKPKRPKKNIHRQVDMSKYRNHPLVKEIDAKEKGYRPRELYGSNVIAPIVGDESEDEDE